MEESAFKQAGYILSEGWRYQRRIRKELSLLKKNNSIAYTNIRNMLNQTNQTIANEAARKRPELKNAIKRKTWRIARRLRILTSEE